MRRALVCLIALLVVSVPAVASHPPASQDPFVGTVEQGETDVHRYDNNPDDRPCIDVMRPYVVQISYAPTTDRLLMEVDGEEVLAEHGTNLTIVERSYCTSFDVAVTGLDVAEVAAYEVHVVQVGLHQ